METACELHPDGALQTFVGWGCNTVFSEVNQTGKHVLPHIWRFYLHAIARLYHNRIGNLVFDISKMSRVVFNYLRLAPY